MKEFINELESTIFALILFGTYGSALLVFTCEMYNHKDWLIGIPFLFANIIALIYFRYASHHKKAYILYHLNEQINMWQVIAIFSNKDDAYKFVDRDGDSLGSFRIDEHDFKY